MGLLNPLLSLLKSKIEIKKEYFHCFGQIRLRREFLFLRQEFSNSVRRRIMCTFKLFYTVCTGSNILWFNNLQFINDQLWRRLIPNASRLQNKLSEKCFNRHCILLLSKWDIWLNSAENSIIWSLEWDINGISNSQSLTDWFSVLFRKFSLVPSI